MNTKFFILSMYFIAAISWFSYANTISVEKTGNGKQPMILIHGMACSANVWNELVDTYKDSYELHLITIPGFGNDQTFNSDHILKSIKDQLISYVRENKLEKPILLGHSMGGFISLWAASEHPDLFGPIISVDGVPYFPSLSMPGMTPENAQSMVEQMNKMMESQTEEQALNFRKTMIATMIATPEKRDKVIEMGMNSTPEVIAQAMGEMYTTDITEQVKNIKSPVLVFGSWAAYEQYGASKPYTTNNYLMQLQSIPDMKFLMAETAYHFIFYDEPEWFYAEVDKFLESKGTTGYNLQLHNDTSPLMMLVNLPVR